MRLSRARPAQLRFIYRASRDTAVTGLQPGDMNLGSKYVFVYALTLNVWRLQKHRSSVGPSATPYAEPHAVNIQLAE